MALMYPARLLARAVRSGAVTEVGLQLLVVSTWQCKPASIFCLQIPTSGSQIFQQTFTIVSLEVIVYIYILHTYIHICIYMLAFEAPCSTPGTFLKWLGTVGQKLFLAVTQALTAGKHAIEPRAPLCAGDALQLVCPPSLA